MLQNATQQNCERFSNPPDGTTYQRHYWTTDASRRLLCKRPSTTRNVKKEGSSKQLRCGKDGDASTMDGKAMQK
ncbi:hypothetical protein AVEN_38911-1, partial [Araneus ventricosus]